MGAVRAGDILDRQRLEWAMREHGVSAVMHFAAYAYVGELVGEPREILPQQCNRRPDPARRHACARRRQVRVFEHVRHLWRSRRRRSSRRSTVRRPSIRMAAPS